MFHGSIPALVTPMRSDGTIDLPAWDALLDFHAREGSDGVVVGGTTGESPVLDRSELEELIRRAKPRLAGRMPVTDARHREFQSSSHDRVTLASPAR